MAQGGIVLQKSIATIPFGRLAETLCDQAAGPNLQGSVLIDRSEDFTHTSSTVWVIWNVWDLVVYLVSGDVAPAECLLEEPTKT